MYVYVCVCVCMYVCMYVNKNVRMNNNHAFDLYGFETWSLALGNNMDYMCEFWGFTAEIFQVEVFTLKMEAAWTSETLVSTTTLHSVTTKKTSTLSYKCLKTKSEGNVEGSKCGSSWSLQQCSEKQVTHDLT
jgi:hypothetical protein